MKRLVDATALVRSLNLCVILNFIHFLEESSHRRIYPEEKFGPWTQILNCVCRCLSPAYDFGLAGHLGGACCEQRKLGLLVAGGALANAPSPRWGDLEGRASGRPVLAEGNSCPSQVIPLLLPFQCR